jgi:acyl carrier protein
MHIEERIIKIISKHYSKKSINSETKFLEDLGVDSLSFIELIVEVEKEFGITIIPDDIEDIQTVGEMAQYINKKGVNCG